MSGPELMDDPLPSAADARRDVPADERPEEESTIMHLERDQLVAETFRPVSQARLGARAKVGLWALRAFVLIVSLMVIYTFIEQLH
jgi:hypothetical protein